MTEIKHKGRTDAPSIAHHVHEVLKRNIGTDVLVRDMVIETGLTKNQILGALQGLRSRRHLEITTIVPGHAYRYTGRLLTPEAQTAPEPTPEPRQGKRLFEEVGLLRDGTMIIQDGDGVLYRASEA